MYTQIKFAQGKFITRSKIEITNFNFYQTSLNLISQILIITHFIIQIFMRVLKGEQFRLDAKRKYTAAHLHHVGPINSMSMKTILKISDKKLVRSGFLH